MSFVFIKLCVCVCVYYTFMNANIFHLFINNNNSIRRLFDDDVESNELKGDR